MIPLRDSIPNVHRPVAVWTLVVLNSLVFIFQQSLTNAEMFRFFHIFGMVPAQFFSFGDPLLVDVLPFLTYQFVHSGWAHFLLNMWVLWVFADNVEDVMGPWRFMVFYLLCGFGALVGHLVFNAGSISPVVGASGAIAGVMGAYLILYPQGTVVTLIPIFFFPYITELPATLFLGIWFAIQLISGLAMAAGGGEGGVAFMAHAAGFVCGIVLLPLFRVKARCYYCYNREAKRYTRKDD